MRHKLFSLAIILLTILLQVGCMNIPRLPVTKNLPTQVSTISIPGEPAIPTMPLTTRNLTPVPTQVEEQSVWIANPVDRTVLRIDALTNSIIATIPIEGEPDVVVAGEGAVWALDRKYKLVFQIDPVKNRVITSIPLPVGTAETLAVGAGYVWVGMTGLIDLTNQLPGEEEDIQTPGYIVQIDPITTEIINELPVQPVRRIAIDGSALWVLSRNTIDTPLQVFDLNSRQGMAVPLRNGPEWLPAEAMAIGPSGLWLFSAAYAKIFHSTSDGRILAAVPFIEKKPSGYADLLLTDNALWAATPWGTILHIDQRTNHLNGQIELEIPLTNLTSAGGAIWAFSQQRAILFRIDPAQTKVTAEIATGNPVQPTVIPTPTSRIVIWKPCPDGPTSRLKVGIIAYVTKDPPLPNRVRKEPNRDAETLGLINPGGGMDIIDGPACSDGWVWWKVKNAEVEGWTAEGDMETYWLIPLYQ